MKPVKTILAESLYWAALAAVVAGTFAWAWNAQMEARSYQPLQDGQVFIVEGD